MATKLVATNLKNLEG